MNDNYPSVTVVVINSRGGHMFKECMDSLKRMRYPGVVDISVTENFDRKKTIGKCWNDAVKQAETDLCVFVGDDDTVNAEYLFVLVSTLLEAEKAVNQIAGVSSFCTVFDGENEGYTNKTPTGMFYTKHLLKHPFDETLKKLVDRKYIDRISDQGFAYIISPFYYGYRYRQHTGKTAGRYQIQSDNEIAKTDIYAVYEHNHFIDPIIEEWKENGYDVKRNDSVQPKYMAGAKLVWCEFAGQNAQVVADSDIPGKKVVRLHAYEAFGKYLNEIKYDKFDKVVFVSDYIKDYCENRIGKMKNAVVIPNGVDLKKFKIPDKGKKRNNKIAVAGYLANKKGSHVLLMLANEFPDFEFHVIGSFQERDVYDLFERKRPANLILYPWTSDLNAFFTDKTFILNTSPRESQGMAIMEGMAAGLKPLVYDWVGAEKIYTQDGVWKSIDELSALLHSDYWYPEEYRKFIKRKYSFEMTKRRYMNLTKEII